MRKFERKARLKAMKRAAKEAKRAQRAAEAAAPVDAAAVPEADGRGEPVCPPGPPHGAAPTLVDAAAEASETLDEAREVHARVLHADSIGEADARAMLARAAALADEVVNMTRAALAEVPLPRLREAWEIVKAKPEPSEIAAQKRPRRGYDPVVSLIKTGLAAASLVQRVLGKLHPNLTRRAA